VEFDFALSGYPIFPALYTATSLGTATTSINAAPSLPPTSMPHRCHRLPWPSPSPTPTSSSTPRRHRLLPRCHAIATGPTLLHCVPLLLRLVLWTFPSAPISALVSLSTFCRFKLRRERQNWFSGTELLFIELSSHVDNLRVVSYSLSLSILLSFVQSASLVLRCVCII
jgi:hypothetical protein